MDGTNDLEAMMAHLGMFYFIEYLVHGISWNSKLFYLNYMIGTHNQIIIFAAITEIGFKNQLLR